MSWIKTLILLVAAVAAKAFEADPEGHYLAKHPHLRRPRQPQPRSLPQTQPFAHDAYEPHQPAA